MFDYLQDTDFRSAANPFPLPYLSCQDGTISLKYKKLCCSTLNGAIICGIGGSGLELATIIALCAFQSESDDSGRCLSLRVDEYWIYNMFLLFSEFLSLLALFHFGKLLELQKLANLVANTIVITLVGAILNHTLGYSGLERGLFAKIGTTLEFVIPTILIHISTAFVAGWTTRNPKVYDSLYTAASYRMCNFF